MRKILVLRGGALGDFIVTLPALALLRLRWPDARIELIGNATAAELVRDGGLLDAVHSQHDARWSALFMPAPLPLDLAQWLRAFDLVINYWPDPEADIGRRFPLRDGQVFLSTEAMPKQAPAAAHYCEPLRTVLGLETRSYFCGLHKGWVVPGGSRDVHSVSPFPISDVRPIAIHPGSGSPRKNWPMECWTELCRGLKQPGDAELLIITGAAEPPDALAGFGRPLRNVPLPELAGQLERCRLYLGHDSGISHLAAACGVPSILLFGPTDPAMWAPPAPHVRVLRRGPEVAGISVAEVQAAISATLGRSDG